MTPQIVLSQDARVQAADAMRQLIAKKCPLATEPLAQGIALVASEACVIGCSRTACEEIERAFDRGVPPLFTVTAARRILDSAADQLELGGYVPLASPTHGSLQVHELGIAVVKMLDVATDRLAFTTEVGVRARKLLRG